MNRFDRFVDRADAGRRLTEPLAELGLENPVILALPRGGVPVAAEVARGLGVGFDVFVARKVGAPGNPEFGIGAIAERFGDAASLTGDASEESPGDTRDGSGEGRREVVGDGGFAPEVVIDTESARAVGVGQPEFAELAAAEQDELKRRVERYRGERRLPVLTDRDVVLIDDGIATGVTAGVAARALRTQSPRRLVLAVPVCAPSSADRLVGLVDEVVCLMRPSPFGAVGRFYRRFPQTTDAEVLELLGRTGV